MTSDSRISNVLALLQNDPNALRVANTASLAKLSNLSESRFRHLFRLCLQQSIGQYLKALRLQRAHLLLRTTELIVKEVAAEVGINDVSHFVRDFKSAFGYYPSHARSQTIRSKVSFRASASTVNVRTVLN
jgi:transcriptional regulator GlxA family with amidase domain